jgi:putative alpha-1,2-mannosidase
MPVRALFVAVALLSVPTDCVIAQSPHLVDFVNTLQGTNSRFELTHGNTYLTTALPFGMHTWTPQTGQMVMRRLYNLSENGYPGDENQGQTSSWYVLSALGLYPVCPGTAEYVIGSPLFYDAKPTCYRHIRQPSSRS